MAEGRTECAIQEVSGRSQRKGAELILIHCRLHSDDGQLEWSSDEDSWAGLMQIVVDERNRVSGLR